MKTLKTMIAACIMFVAMSAIGQSAEHKQLMSDAQKAKTELIKKDADLAAYFKKSVGYVIFPNVGKGGLIIGGASGHGIVYEDGDAIGSANLKELNIGFQAGGQAIIEVLFFETKEALAKFKEGNFEFAAGVSAVAVDQGASKKANYSDGVMVFALPKAGLMADASVGGQKFGYKAFAQ